MASTSRTAVLWRFDEPDVGVQPRDEARNIDDLVPVAGTAPAVTDAFLGPGRQFAATQAFRGAELVAHATRLRRNMALEAVLSFEAGKIADGTYTIVARGRSGSAPERRLFGLRLETASGVVTLRMFWERAGGGQATVPGAAFIVPGTTGQPFFYVAAVRRWVSTVDVLVDYYVNGQLVETTSSAHGDIVDGDGGTITVGCRGDGTGGYEHYFIDILDEVRISCDDRTAEEIRQTYRQIFGYPRHSYETMLALLPPGQAWSRDPASAVQRELMVEADALGLPWGLAQELGDDFLPDRATKTLTRWEAVTRLAPGPLETYASRRARVVGHLRKIHGYSRDKIRQAVYRLLDVDLDDVALLENSNHWSDDFADAAVDGRWFQEPNDGTILEASGVLKLAIQVGDDARWTATMRRAVACRLALVGRQPQGAYGARVSQEYEVIAHMDGRTLVNGAECGIFLLDKVTEDAHLFGVRHAGGAPFMFHKRIKAGVLTGPTSLGTSPVDSYSDFWLRIRQLETGNLDLDYSLVGSDGPWTTLAAAQASITDPTNAGVFLQQDTAPAGAGSDVTWADWLVRTPQGRLVYQWYLYRDPGLGGAPDIAGAQLVVDRMKPAHTQGSVCQSDGFRCDDPYSLCDRDPLGA